MKRTLHIICVLAGLISPVYAADFAQCTDKNGDTFFTNTAPPPGATCGVPPAASSDKNGGSPQQNHSVVRCADGMTPVEQTFVAYEGNDLWEMPLAEKMKKYGVDSRGNKAVCSGISESHKFTIPRRSPGPDYDLQAASDADRYKESYLKDHKAVDLIKYQIELRKAHGY